MERNKFFRGRENIKYSHPHDLMIVACSENEGWVYYVTSRDDWRYRRKLCNDEYKSIFWSQFIPSDFKEICRNGYIYPNNNHHEAINIWKQNRFNVVEFNFNT